MSKQEFPRSTLGRRLSREGAAEEQASFEAADQRRITVTVRTTSIKTPTTGKNLSFTFSVTVRTSVTEGLIKRLGFDARRLFDLGIVPAALPLAQDTLVREAPAEEEPRLKRRILEQHMQWARTQDFNDVIMNQIGHFVRRGPESRLHGMDAEPAPLSSRPVPPARGPLV